jgi:hypothetical protein
LPAPGGDIRAGITFLILQRDSLRAGYGLLPPCKGRGEHNDRICENLALGPAHGYDDGREDIHMKAVRVSLGRCRSRRRGAATLDYVLALGALLPIAGLTLYQSGRIIRAVYQFTCVFISWPFM